MHKWKRFSITIFILNSIYSIIYYKFLMIKSKNQSTMIFLDSIKIFNDESKFNFVFLIKFVFIKIIIK